jgi:transcription-repair coupling factor (superfamily II helicase)
VEISAQRVDALQGLLSGRARILVTTPRALIERSPIPVGGGDSLALDVEVGDTCGLSELAERLEQMGFERTDTVREVGDFAVRGGIVDAFPFGHPAPVRIELWGDDVESIRRFDALSQRSSEPESAVEILPISLRVDRNAETERRSLLELLPPASVLVCLDAVGIGPAQRRLWEEVREARARAGHETEQATALVLPPEDARARIETLSRIDLEESDEAIRLPVAPPPRIDRDMGRLIAELERAREDGVPAILLCDNEGQLERLEEILVERGGPTSPAPSRSRSTP